MNDLQPTHAKIISKTLVFLSRTLGWGLLLAILVGGTWYAIAREIAIWSR